MAGDGVAQSHVLLKTGDVVWCTVCGSYAECKAVRLLSTCSGPPVRALGSGGRVAQLARLKAGLHPVTRERLGETTELDGTRVMRTNRYSRLEGELSSASDPNFHPYLPEALPPYGGSVAANGNGQTARQKAAQRVRRVKLKVKRAKAKVQEAELEELIDSFVNGETSRSVVEGICSDEEFWNALDHRDWNTPQSSNPVDVHCGGEGRPLIGRGRVAARSRLERLMWTPR